MLLIFALISFIIGIICFLYNVAMVRRFKDEVEAVVISTTQTSLKPNYQVENGSDGSLYETVQYKYKGLILKSQVKTSKVVGETLKVRVNPKKPNQCCLPRPYLEGLIIWSIVAAFFLGYYIKLNFF